MRDSLAPTWAESFAVQNNFALILNYKVEVYKVHDLKNLSELA
jgi:hypothetical protein